MSFTDADTTVNPHSHKGGNDMSNYNGYLLKFGNNIMPNKYITAFSSTPNQHHVVPAIETDEIRTVIAK